MSYSLDSPTGLGQDTSAYKDLYNYKLFAFLFHTFYIPICQIVEVGPPFLYIYNVYLHLITIHQIKYYF